jgi:tetratricopeptide (TPR) repeat protein
MQAPGSQRRIIPLAVLGLGLLALLAALTWVAVLGWYRSELHRIEEDLAEGRTASARQRLRRIAWNGSDNAEIRFLLGACERADGHVEAAIENWTRVPRSSSRWIDATVQRAQLALAEGRFAQAESALLEANPQPGHPAWATCEQMLLQLYLLTIRYDEIGRRKVKEWSRTHNPENLRVHWLIDETKSFAVGATRDRLEEAGQVAPNDDRVWLGKANLAIRTGQKEEAAAWLQRCQERRRDDPDVWLARLDWAVAFNLVEDAIEATRHLPARFLHPVRILAIRAWLAAQRKEIQAEREALDQVLMLEPGNAQALVRLSEIASVFGQTYLVAQLHQRKMEADKASDEYRMLLTDDPYFRSAAAGREGASSRDESLARCAEQLGRWFEARGWWTLILERTPDHKEAREALARLDKKDQGLYTSPIVKQIARGKTLADVLVDLIDRSAREPNQVHHSPEATIPGFRDQALSSGLRFVYDNDPTPRCRMPETMGGGVGLLDFDGDGWLDVYAVQGGTFPDPSGGTLTPQRDRLFRNRGDGTFEDVTERSHLSSFPGGYGHGVTVGDYDGDGWPDLFITRWRAYALYHNRGDGTFEDVTLEAGLGGSRDWPTSAAFADFDGDGDLDLYVCHYSAWDPQTSGPCPHAFEEGRFMYCGPRTFAAEPDHVFRNDHGRFTDVSDKAGIAAADREGRGLGVVAADLDSDGRIDVFVANDLTANFLFHNEGRFRFREIGFEAGVATNADGGYLAGMGVACGDLDGDGQIDLAVTNFYGESTTFYRSLGRGQFVDQTSAVGLATSTRYLLGFGTSFLDVNNDGRLDLATANGHVNDLRPHVPYAMPAQLLLAGQEGRLRDVSAKAGEPWSVLRLGRGLASGDLDNDGKLDLLIVSEGAPLACLRNQGPAAHFVTLKLEGTASNRDAVGARVTVTSAGKTQVAQRCGGGSFLSACDQRVHFGLGTAARIESIEVRWPSGRVDHHSNLATDTGYLLREGEPHAHTLRGWVKK